MHSSAARNVSRFTLIAVALGGCGDSPGPVGPGGGGNGAVVDVAFIVDSIRVAWDLPALAGAIVTMDDVSFGAGVSGTRRASGGPQATLHDLWHLGSNFKAFTGMLAAVAVDRGDIGWDETIAQALPELAVSMRTEYEHVTLRDLLSHQSGLPRDPAEGTIIGTTRTQQRNSVAAWAVGRTPVSAHGTYSYTNTGYMIAAAMVERAMGTTFEQAMVAHVFEPLGIQDAGFGPQAEPGSSLQPVAHMWINNRWSEREAFDNPPVYASAGGAHMSVDSWARFLQEVLRLEAGSPTIVSAAAGAVTTASIATVSPADSYGLGWLVTSRTWANGRTLTHDGSNTANHSVTWMAPTRGFAVLAVTNSYDAGLSALTRRALDALAGRLIYFYNTGG